MDETKTIEISQRLFMLFGGLIAAVAIFMLAQIIYQFQSLPQNYPQDITVTGEGKAYAKPDVAVINFGAHTEALKSQDAVVKNNEIMEAVIKSVKELGVEAKDIKTMLYNLTPLYEYTSFGRSPAPMIYPYPEQKRIFKGYILDQQIEVKIRNFDNISAILDKASANGANTIGELHFVIDDMEKVKTEAREKAIARAKEKAKSLFEQSGLRIVKLVNINEGYGYPQPYAYGMGGAMEKDAMPVSAPQIEVGQNEVTTTVNLTYRVR